MNWAIKDVRLSSHTQYYTEYHICWLTKYHRPTLTLAIRRYLNRLLPRIMETMPGCEVITSNILNDHVHIVMIIPPKYAVMKVVGRLKGRTSSLMQQKYPELRSPLWTPGYCVKTVGVPEEKVIEYVCNQ